ncbi:desulfoferrodoxin [candidate division KSB3 bacterium]|uniref:Desulfoferrodoxin n=1 Tax=candidate division KSB3 bacterium TaxID=2044937 RepID=A0A9D5JX09_9BACT|nr:desulfoferrodoxin [candidate division KSB3 bacterium]MBD3325286.1 desulfoferrodoxin [candidate division KSB3 bacterium]
MAFAEYIRAPEHEGKEKHVPDIALSANEVGTVVTLQVGKEVLHPTTKEHHIQWVQLFGETQEGKFVQIAALNFGEGTSLPRGCVVIKKEDYKSLVALAYCNLHGVWDNSVTL